MVEAVLLVKVERIHIGSDRDGARTRSRSLEGPDHAGAREATVDLDAELFEALRHHIRGALLLEGGLGVRMNVAPPRGEVLVEIGDTIEDGHAAVVFRVCWSRGVKGKWTTETVRQ